MPQIIECPPLFKTAGRPGPLARFVEQAREKYAKHKPGHGQTGLFDEKPVQSHTKKWTDEDEQKHPRDESGEWTSGGGETSVKKEESKPQEQESSEPAKSKGHVGFFINETGTQYELYQDDKGDLFRAPVSDAIATDSGTRFGRFEAKAGQAEKTAEGLIEGKAETKLEEKRDDRSDQRKSHDEFITNADNVAADPRKAASTNIYRAMCFLSGEARHHRRRLAEARDEHRLLDAENIAGLIAGIEAESQWYEDILKERGWMSKTHGAPGWDEPDPKPMKGAAPNIRPDEFKDSPPKANANLPTAEELARKSIDTQQNVHALIREAGFEGEEKRNMTHKVIAAKNEIETEEKAEKEAKKPDVLAEKAAAGEKIERPEGVSEGRWGAMVKQKASLAATMAEQIQSHPAITPATDDERQRHAAISAELAKSGIPAEEFGKWLKRYREVQGRKAAKEKEQEPAEPSVKLTASEQTKETPPEGDQIDKPVPDSLFDTPDGKSPDEHDSPRKAAEEATKRQIDSDYAFARASKVRNAGEDLLGSARHRANAWKGLAEAEKDGTAAEFVTRDMLLKSEPHGLMNHVARNPLTALAMHYALRAFPAKPQYGKYELSGDAAKEAREQYLDVYRRYKEKAEDLAKGEENPMTAASQLQKFVEAERARLYGSGRRTNPIGNALYATSTHLGKRYSGIGKQMEEFSKAFAKKYHGGKPIGHDNAPDDTLEKLADHASDMIEGASLNKSFDIANEKGEGAKKAAFNAAEAYVKKAERIGGPAIGIKTADEGKDYLIDRMKMRGLQFGNYVTDEEREHHLLKVSEACADLADVLGLPQHLVAWKGKLGIAFGARGHGTASAHHEPSTHVINLTRASGVGAFAHEWGHFFDHALGGFAQVTEGRGYFSELAYHAPMGTPADQEAFNKKYFPNKPKASGAADNPAMIQAYQALHKSMDDSGFNTRLSGVLSRHVREKTMGEKKRDYWRSTREKFARCFERYVQRKLEKQGRKNTYLAGLAGGGPGGAHELWPNDAEVDAMIPHFDAIFTELREGAAKGKYSRLLSGQLTERYQRQRLTDHIAAQLVERYARRSVRPAAGQAAMFANPETPDLAWNEKKHPRESDGKFTDNSATTAATPAPGQKDLFGGETTPADSKPVHKTETPSPAPQGKQEQLWSHLDEKPGQGKMFETDRAGEEKEKPAEQPKAIGLPDPLTTKDPETGKYPHEMTKEELTRHKDYDVNNSLTPYAGKIPPVGSWRLDPYSGGLEQLQRVSVDQLNITENQDDVKHRDDYLQYVEWAKQGKQPPPITVIHNVHGQWNSLNRRRLMAAREAGHKDILAWVADTNMESGAAEPKWEDVKKRAAGQKIAQQIREKLGNKTTT